MVVSYTDDTNGAQTHFALGFGYKQFTELFA